MAAKTDQRANPTSQDFRPFKTQAHRNLSTVESSFLVRRQPEIEKTWTTSSKALSCFCVRWPGLAQRPCHPPLPARLTEMWPQTHTSSIGKWWTPSEALWWTQRTFLPGHRSTSRITWAHIVHACACTHTHTHTEQHRRTTTSPSNVSPELQT